MKKQKKFFAIFITLLLAFTFIPNVKAASANISVSSSKNKVIVGNNVTVTVTVSTGDSLAGIIYTLQYDSSILSLSSTSAPTGGAYNLDVIMNNGTKRKSYTYNFKVKKSGTASIGITGAEIKNDSNSTLSVSASSTKITCMTQAELEATYSKNNNLSSLSIEGYNLSPAFDANKTEYTAEINPETESIVVNATKADSSASISGAGEVPVSDGANTIKIDVTAQNGNVKTYTIVVTVPELDPINVKVGDKDFTVVRSKKALDFSNSLFTETTTLINGTEVPAFHNDATNITVVGLKDADGKITYFKVSDDNYTEYKEFTVGSLSIMLDDAKDIPFGYKEFTTTINDIDYVTYKSKEDSRFALIYGINLQTGETGYYTYDIKEETLQKFDDENAKCINDNVKKLKIIICSLIGTTVLFFIGMILSLTKKNSSKHKKSIKSIFEDDNDKNNDSKTDNETKKELKKLSKKEKKIKKEKRNLEKEEIKEELKKIDKNHFVELGTGEDEEDSSLIDNQDQELINDDEDIFDEMDDDKKEN